MNDNLRYFGEAPLAGKCVIITGGGSGIGRATAEMAAAAGARVVVADISGADITTAGIGMSAEAVRLDVADAASWDACVSGVISRHGQIDGLVNVAGIAMQADSLTNQTEEGWDRIIDINLKGSWLGMRAVLPHMLDSGAGRIINISSTAAIGGMPGSIAYAASKAGIIGMSRQAAIEFAPKGLRINVVAPGIIQTPMLGDGAQDSVAAMSEMTPVRRIGEPDEIASMICYLLGPGSDFVTGQTFVVDGGWTAQ